MSFSSTAVNAEGAMTKFPTIDDQKLTSMWKRILLVARDCENSLRYIDETDLNPRTTNFNVRPKLGRPAENIFLLIKSPMYLPLLSFGAIELKATVAEVFAQLVQPIHPGTRAASRHLGNIHAIELTSTFTVNEAENHIVAFINLYRRRGNAQ